MHDLVPPTLRSNCATRRAGPVALRSGDRRQARSPRGFGRNQQLVRQSCSKHGGPFWPKNRRMISHGVADAGICPSVWGIFGGLFLQATRRRAGFSAAAGLTGSGFNATLTPGDPPVPLSCRCALLGLGIDVGFPLGDDRASLAYQDPRAATRRRGARPVRLSEQQVLPTAIVYFQVPRRTAA